MNEFVTVLLSICGGVSIIGGAITIIIKLFSPLHKLKNRVDAHDSLLKKDLDRLNVFEETNKVICKCLLALLDHEITGNSEDKLILAKEELTKYLINK